MRKTIIATILPFVIYSAAFAQEKNTRQSENMDIPGFENLVINANAKVILKESEKPYLQLNGSPAFIKSVKIKNCKSEMSINSNYYGFKETGNTLTIGVKKLKYLFVRQDADIVSGNTLSSPLLNILLDGSVTLKLANFGKTNVAISEGYCLEE